MPKTIDCMTTENVTETRNASMYITKAFEIRFFISIKYAWNLY